MNPRDQVNALLAKDGAVLVRNKNHEVWRLSNGQKFVRGLTSSDTKADANSLSDLKHALGIVKTEAVVGERRVRQLKRKSEPNGKLRSINTLRDKMPATLIEESLRDEVERQKRDIDILFAALEALRAQPEHNCRWCKLKKWWHRHESR